MLLNLAIFPLLSIKVQLFDGNKLIDQLPRLILTPIVLPEKLISLILEIVGPSRIRLGDFPYTHPIFVHLFRKMVRCVDHICFLVVKEDSVLIMLLDKRFVAGLDRNEVSLVDKGPILALIFSINLAGRHI